MPNSKMSFVGNTTLNNVPDNTTLNIRNGSLTITGDIGKNVFITHRGSGNVMVEGRVKAGSSIQSDGKVTVDNPLERGYGRNKFGRPHYGVTIKAKGDVTVNAGVGNYSTLHSEGDVKVVTLASNCDVLADGDLDVKYGIYNASKVLAGGKVTAKEISDHVQIETLGGPIEVAGEVGHYVTLKQQGNGGVTVRGRVRGGTTIESSGDVTLESTLAYGDSLDFRHERVNGHATVKAGGNIQVTAGVGYAATLEAGGNIDAICIGADSKITAGGDVNVKYEILRNSKVSAGGKVNAGKIYESVQLKEGVTPRPSFVERLKGSRGQASTQVAAR